MKNSTDSACSRQLCFDSRSPLFLFAFQDLSPPAETVSGRLTSPSFFLFPTLEIFTTAGIRYDSTKTRNLIQQFTSLQPGFVMVEEMKSYDNLQFPYSIRYIIIILSDSNICIFCVADVVWLVIGAVVACSFDQREMVAYSTVRIYFAIIHRFLWEQP